MEAKGRERIAKLEAEVEEIQQMYDKKAQAYDQKAEDVDRLEKFVNELEMQVSSRNSSEELIQQLEAALEKERAGKCSEEQVNKLILAAAGERNKVKQAEQERDDALKQLELARGEAVVQAEAGQQTAQLQQDLQFWKDKFYQEEERRREKEDQLLNLSDLNSKLLEMPDLEAKLESETKARVEAESKLKEAEKRVSDLQAELLELKEKGTGGDGGEERWLVNDLRKRLDGEQKKSIEVEDRLLESHRRRAELHEELKIMREQLNQASSQVDEVKATGDDVMQRLLEQAEQRAAEKEKKLLDLEGKMSAREEEIRKLNVQLGEELKQHQEVRRQVAVKEKEISDLQTAAMSGGGDVALNTKVIEKEREVCELQCQLQSELSKRQEANAQIIAKERIICDLQSKLWGTSFDETPVNSHRLLELPINADGVQVSARGRALDPVDDDEDEDGFSSPGGPDMETIYSNRTPSYTPVTPAQSTRLSNWSSQVTQVQVQTMGSPAPIYRGPATMPVSSENFVRQVSGPAARPSARGFSPQAPANQKRRGSVGSGGYRQARFIPAGPGPGAYYAQQGVIASSAAPSWGATAEDRHARRLMLATKTFS